MLPNTPLPENKDKRDQERQNACNSERMCKRVEDFREYARTNPTDTIALVILILGIFLLFFHPFWGGIIVGIIAGIYFSPQIICQVQAIKTYIEEKGPIRSLIFIGILLALFLSAPAIVLAAAATAAFKYIFMPSCK